MKTTILKFLLLFILPSILYSAISDKLIVSNINHSKYEITRLMMKTQYVDRKFKLQKIPSFLLGSVFIKTANDDKSCSGEKYLTFDVNKEVTVYVAQISSIKVTPKWLKDSFIKTNLKINSGEEDFILYKKVFPKGTISLGGNIEVEEEDHGMYSVIITERLDIPEIVDYAVSDYKSLLLKFDTYSCSSSVEIPSFVYQNQNDSVLIQLRIDLKLDSIVKNKDEVLQIIDLMKWVNKRVNHNGSNDMYDSRTRELIDGFDKTGKGINCSAVSIILNDIYLAMGFKARIISCMPHEDYDTESHVTNLVYSRNLKKWLYMDPSFCAYVTDDNGLILNHSEIRKALIKGDKLIVKGGLIHNGESYGGGQDYYLNNYMSKNLLRFRSPLISIYGYEYSNSKRTYIYLNPKGYKDELIDYSNNMKNKEQVNSLYIQDDTKFWQNPEN